MAKKRLQIVLPDALVEKFYSEAKKQNRTASNLGRKYISEGLTKDDIKK